MWSLDTYFGRVHSRISQRGPQMVDARIWRTERTNPFAKAAPPHNSKIRTSIIGSLSFVQAATYTQPQHSTFGSLNHTARNRAVLSSPPPTLPETSTNCFMKLLGRHSRTLRRWLLLLVVPPLLRQGVVGQQEPTCDSAKADAVHWLNLRGQCTNVSPLCECGHTDDGIFYGACADQNVQCSSMDSSVCGSQSSAVAYGHASATYAVVYVWQYTTSARTEKLSWVRSFDGTCTFAIEQISGATTYCACQWTNCNGAAAEINFLYVDCSNYESGAIADECLDGLGVSTGSVLEGLAVTFGGQCAAADGTDLVPVPAPIPSGGGGGNTPSGPGPTPASTPSSSGSVPTSTTSSRTVKATKKNVGAIVGAVVGVLLAVLATSGLYARHHQQNQPVDSTAAGTEEEGKDPPVGSDGHGEPTTSPSDSFDEAPAASEPEADIIVGPVSDPAHTREYIDESGARVVEEVYYL